MLDWILIHLHLNIDAVPTQQRGQKVEYDLSSILEQVIKMAIVKRLDEFCYLMTHTRIGSGTSRCRVIMALPLSSIV